MKTLKCLTAICLIILCTYSCKKDKDNQNSNQNGSNEQFSFFGDLSIVQDSIENLEPIDLSYKDSSVVVGSFFVKSDGSVASFSGFKNSDKININGSINGQYSGSFQGSINILGNDHISISINGNNFSASGSLAKQACIKVKGKYFVEETVDIAITVDGQTQTQHTEGNGFIQLAQENCSISYTVPGTNTVRTGEVQGNKFILSGDFIIPQTGMTLTKNLFYAAVIISDNYKYEFTGHGVAQGTYEGSTFSVTGTDKGVLRKYFEAAVAAYRGGFFEWWIDPNFNQIKEQIDNAYEDRVITKCFVTKFQNEKMHNWLNGVNSIIPGHTPPLIIVGHSYGANALRVGDYSSDNLFSRISIDPINPELILQLIFDQRSFTYDPVTISGDYFNYLATSTAIINGQDPHGLLGHHINTQNLSEQYEENTNHMTIVDRVVERQYVLNEVTRCLSQKHSDYLLKSNNEIKLINSNKINTIISIINVHR